MIQPIFIQALPSFTLEQLQFLVDYANLKVEFSHGKAYIQVGTLELANFLH